MRKFNLNKYKPYFYIFIIAEIFLFSIYYIFSNQIADNTFYLQLRRFFALCFRNFYCTLLLAKFEVSNY